MLQKVIMKIRKQIVMALTGTPGTGKTSVGRALAKRGWLHLELNKLVAEKKLYSGWDKKRKTWIVNENKLARFVRNFIIAHPSKNIVVDSHVSHALPAKFFSVVFVLRCEPKILEARLKKKHWSREKIRENVEAEIIGLVEWEACKKHKKIFSMNTSEQKIAATANAILRKLRFIRGWKNC